MRQFLASVLVYFLVLIQRNQSNPVNAYPHHMISPPGFMAHPAMMQLYHPLQYPFPIQHQFASNLDELQQATNGQQTVAGNTNNQQSNSSSKDDSKNEEDNDDANKRDDEDSFWEAAQSYGKNRWTNFKDGFTELYDVFKAAGRGFKNIFVGGGE